MKKLLLAFACALFSVQASAADITQNIAFTATNFADDWTGSPAPQETVVGDITWTWDTDAAFGPGGVDAINLTIGDYTYLAEDVGWTKSRSTGVIIFGDTRGCGVGGLCPATNDFGMTYDPTGAYDPTFDYTTIYTYLRQWSSEDVTQVVTTVPLPGAAWLFLSAIGGLGIIKRKRKSPAQ